ncbi:MAG: hypothetical protein V4629_00070 [Pseudomonadota bacterium]
MKSWWNQPNFLKSSWLIIIFSILLLYAFLYIVLKQPLLSHNPLDSYALQAATWWNGKIALTQDYSYLELAYFNHEIFVSFPPTPTLPHFLLYPWFGENTPNNFMNTCYAIIAFAIAVFLMQGFNNLKNTAIAICAIFGSNALALSLHGGVWFQAQLLALLLTFLAFTLLCIDNIRLKYIHFSLLSLALAVGCRPLNILYFPLVVLLISHRTSLSVWQVGVRFFYVPTFIGALYAWYNYIRFGNPLEFGHLYLLEHRAESLGQFNWRYILQNFLNSFRLPFWTDSGGLSFPRFDGVLFFLVNPIFLIFFVKLSQWKKSFVLINTVILLTLLTHMIATFSHKTMGVWQFGNRYFVDFIPLLLLYMRLNQAKANTFDILLCVFGVFINLYGTLWWLLNWP